MKKKTVALAGLAVALFGVTGFALDLVKEGKPASSIVVADSATKTEQQAAQTLVKYLKMCSGAEPPIVKESAKPAGALVSMGKTQMAKAAGITDEGLKYDGYRLAVKGGTLYLIGRDTELIKNSGAQGSIRAALGLLERLGFRWLQPTPVGTYAPPLKTVTVPDDLNVTYDPPMMYMHGRMTNWGDWSLANGFREAVRIWGGAETWVYGVPATLYDTHPEYFVMANGKRVKPVRADNPQYCPSNPDVQRLIAEWAIKKLDEGYEIVGLCQSDGCQPCQCEVCSKLSPSDQIHNAERNIIEMIAKKHPDRKVNMLIYGPTNKPPSQFKSYPPNTMTEVCMTEMVQTEFGSHDKALDYWSKAIPGGLTLGCYYMGLYYDNGLSPRFYPELAAAKMKNWLVNHGVQGIYWCGGGENWGAEGPTYYMLGRMAVDPTQDWKKVYDEYLNLTFGKAAPAMKRYYDTLYERLKRFRHHQDDWVVSGIGIPNDTFAATYSADALLKLRNSLDAARKDAAGDEGALGWVRTAEISYNHYALIARAFHYYQAYLLNPTPGNLQQTRDAVNAYQTWAEETVQIYKKDKPFVDSFLPNFGMWTNEKLKTNYNHLRCAPFVGDFERKATGSLAAPATVDLSLTGWTLQFSDGFARADLGPDWQPTKGNWTIANGALVASSDRGCEIICSRRFPGAQRLEYDASTDNPGDLSAYLGIDATGFPTGYFFGFGCDENRVCKLFVKDAEMKVYGGTVTAGKVHHVICQRDGDVLVHAVDGKILMTYRDPTPLKGDGHQMVGLYVWKTGRISNVKVYTKPE